MAVEYNDSEFQHKYDQYIKVSDSSRARVTGKDNKSGRNNMKTRKKSIEGGAIPFRESEMMAIPERKKAYRKNESNGNGLFGLWESFVSTPKGRFIATVMVVTFGFMGVSGVFAAACAAEIKYEIHQIKKANEDIVKEMETIDLAIQSTNNIAVLEARALGELDMVYANANNTVYIEKSVDPQPMDMASLIRSEAYDN